MLILIRTLLISIVVCSGRLFVKKVTEFTLSTYIISQKHIAIYYLRGISEGTYIYFMESWNILNKLYVLHIWNYILSKIFSFIFLLLSHYPIVVSLKAQLYDLEKNLKYILSSMYTFLQLSIRRCEEWHRSLPTESEESVRKPVPSKWMQIQRHTYTLYHARITWEEAAIYCRLLGARLAILKNSNIIEILVNSMTKARPGA